MNNVNLGIPMDTQLLLRTNSNKENSFWSEAQSSVVKLAEIFLGKPFLEKIERHQDCYSVIMLEIKQLHENLVFIHNNLRKLCETHLKEVVSKGRLKEFVKVVLERLSKPNQQTAHEPSIRYGTILPSTWIHFPINVYDIEVSSRQQFPAAPYDSVGILNDKSSFLGCLSNICSFMVNTHTGFILDALKSAHLFYKSFVVALLRITVTMELENSKISNVRYSARDILLPRVADNFPTASRTVAGRSIDPRQFEARSIGSSRSDVDLRYRSMYHQNNGNRFNGPLLAPMKRKTLLATPPEFNKMTAGPSSSTTQTVNVGAAKSSDAQQSSSAPQVNSDSAQKESDSKEKAQLSSNETRLVRYTDWPYKHCLRETEIDCRVFLKMVVMTETDLMNIFLGYDIYKQYSNDKMKEHFIADMQDYVNQLLKNRKRIDHKLLEKRLNMKLCGYNNFIEMCDVMSFVSEVIGEIFKLKSKKHQSFIPDCWMHLSILNYTPIESFLDGNVMSAEALNEEKSALGYGNVGMFGQLCNLPDCVPYEDRKMIRRRCLRFVKQLYFDLIRTVFSVKTSVENGVTIISGYSWDGSFDIPSGLSYEYNGNPEEDNSQSSGDPDRFIMKEMKDSYWLTKNNPAHEPLTDHYAQWFERWNRARYEKGETPYDDKDDRPAESGNAAKRSKTS